MPTRNIVVSSAKRTVQSGGRTLGKSLIKSENRVGPRTEPCGTPEVVEPGEVGHMSDLGATREVGLEPGDTGRIKTKAVELGEQKWMIHTVKILRNIKKRGLRQTASGQVLGTIC